MKPRVKRAQQTQRIQSAQQGQRIQSAQQGQRIQSAQQGQRIQLAQQGQRIQSAQRAQQGQRIQSAQQAQRIQSAQQGQRIQLTQQGQRIQSAQQGQQGAGYGPVYHWGSQMGGSKKHSGCRLGEKKRCVGYDGPDMNDCVKGPDDRCRFAKGLRRAFNVKQPASERKLAALAKARAVRARNILARKAQRGGRFF